MRHRCRWTCAGKQAGVRQKGDAYGNTEGKRVDNPE